MPSKDALLIYAVESLRFRIMRCYHFYFSFVISFGVTIALLVKQGDVVRCYWHSSRKLIGASNAFLGVLKFLNKHDEEGLIILIVFSISDWNLTDVVAAPPTLFPLMWLSPQLLRKFALINFPNLFLDFL